jgi:hypothetical protein
MSHNVSSATASTNNEFLSRGRNDTPTMRVPNSDSLTLTAALLSHMSQWRRRLNKAAKAIRRYTEA